jgi:acetyl-CoA carboxylase carboxyl transferase subunit alpha
MPTETLEFEESLAPLLKEVDALSALPRTEARERELERLNHKLRVARTEIYSKLTPWQRVLVSRHPSRPDMLDYVARLFTDFVELHGDRRFADDHAIVAGTACYKGEPVMVVGHHKGGDTKQKIYRNFGYARPEGYRKAMRVMQMAQKFSRPIVVFIDTPAAYPGMESEERGVAEAIAVNLREMMMIEVPIIVMVCGEGGSGGALGIAIGDRVMMQEFSVYSVIPPEGCAAILWRDANRKVEAATALKITASDMVALGLVDDIIPEPPGGAHNDYDAAAALVDQALSGALEDSARMTVPERLDARYAKFRRMGEEGTSFTDTSTDSTTPDLLARRSLGEGGKVGPTGR